MAIRSKPFNAVKSLFVVFALTACNTTSGLEQSVDNPMSYLTYAAVNQDVKTVVLGNPTRATDDELERVVIDALQQNYTFLNTKFTTKTSERVVEPYKIVFAFNPAAHVMGHTICQNPNSVEFETQPNKTVIMALFCDSDDALTEIAAFMETPADIKDGEFIRTIDYLAWKLVPIDDKTSSDECINPSFC
jgi:hypothetical protein